MKLAFLGLGVMGYPMAGHWQKAGHDVCVYNRTTSKAEAWASEHGGRYASSPSEAVAGAQIVAMCLGDDPDVEMVVLGEHGVLEGLEPGAVLVDHTTGSAKLAQKLHELCAAKKIGFVDAPVSGGQAGAENGQLGIMCGGNEDDFAAVKDALDIYAKSCVLIGGPGDGQLCKMVNQICIAGVLQGLAEGLHFAETTGIDAERVLSVISKGAAQSWQMENRGMTMVADQFDFGFAVDWMRKDLRICLEEARARGVSLPTTAMIDQYYADVQNMGGGRWDTSSLIARLSGKH
ncbi:MAG: NAD(P)-dependent oxidoreductase [Alphaproteobacteria bacterium TMED150]|nr:oxidoreductase [Paracoccaceae bacterium]RPH14005.1 MAG: NAD(P)-dependent oxidoreductase [Alphaproteobacteria bacterium TMED150]